MDEDNLALINMSFKFLFLLIAAMEQWFCKKLEFFCTFMKVVLELTDENTGRCGEVDHDGEDGSTYPGSGDFEALQCFPQEGTRVPLCGESCEEHLGCRPEVLLPGEGVTEVIAGPE